jgi:hypothetical protein
MAAFMHAIDVEGDHSEGDHFETEHPETEHPETEGESSIQPPQMIPYDQMMAGGDTFPFPDDGALPIGMLARHARSTRFRYMCPFFVTSKDGKKIDLLFVYASSNRGDDPAVLLPGCIVYILEGYESSSIPRVETANGEDFPITKLGFRPTKFLDVIHDFHGTGKVRSIYANKIVDKIRRTKTPLSEFSEDERCEIYTMFDNNAWVWNEKHHSLMTVYLYTKLTVRDDESIHIDMDSKSYFSIPQLLLDGQTFTDFTHRINYSATYGIELNRIDRLQPVNYIKSILNVQKRIYSIIVDPGWLPPTLVKELLYADVSTESKPLSLVKVKGGIVKLGLADGVFNLPDILIRRYKTIHTCLEDASGGSSAYDGEIIPLPIYTMSQFDRFIAIDMGRSEIVSLSLDRLKEFVAVADYMNHTKWLVIVWYIRGKIYSMTDEEFDEFIGHRTKFDEGKRIEFTRTHQDIFMNLDKKGWVKGM